MTMNEYGAVSGMRIGRGKEVFVYRIAMTITHSKYTFYLRIS
jgi:hypothetical protein